MQLTQSSSKKSVFLYIFLCLLSELLARCQDFFQIVSRRRAGRFNDKSCVNKLIVICKPIYCRKKKNINMLFAGLRSVRMVKNYDLGLENGAVGLRPRTAFSRPRSQFFTIRTSQPANNIYIFWFDIDVYGFSDTDNI